MSNPIGDPGHGDSPAAWTAVIIMLVMIAIGTFAFFLNVPWLVWTCAVLTIVGFFVGVVMSRAGYGARGPKYQQKSH